MHSLPRALIPVFVALGLCATSTADAGPKNRKTATWLSAGSAGVSGAVVVAGFMTSPAGERFNAPVMYTGLGLLFVTPSAGQFYGGQYLNIGMGIRALSAGLAVYTLQTQTRLATCDTAHSSNEPPCEVFTEGAYPLLGIAAIGFIGGVWYDVFDAGDAVDKWNAEHGFTITPAVPTASGAAPGLTLSGTF